MTDAPPAVAREHDQVAVDLYWLPLGAGGRFVRRNGVIYEALAAVGTRWAGGSRFLRYGIRRWRDGSIPDADEAVDSPRRISGPRVGAQE